MVNKKNEILCPHCGKNTGYTHEGLMFLVLQDDLKCPYCNKIVIFANKINFLE